MSGMSGRTGDHVVVVGAGLGGLSAACHLAGRGYDVTVIEAADVPGGRAGVAERDGWTKNIAAAFRLATHPSVWTAVAYAAISAASTASSSKPGEPSWATGWPAYPPPCSPSGTRRSPPS
jgi:phytoene desaturase